MKTASFLTLALICGSLVIGFPALADKDKGKGRGYKSSHERIVWDDNSDRKQGVVIIRDHDRAVLRDYIGQNRRSFCPPGLAKKRTGCLPPGQFKKLTRGDVIPETVSLQSLPEQILEQLLRPPVGTAYARVDDNVYLINESTRKVMDAVSLLSQVR